GKQKAPILSNQGFHIMVPQDGLEPSLLSKPDF
ncbi:MAG: hypothetical protein ACI9YH_003844, partial [Colwellia sp.]